MLIHHPNIFNRGALTMYCDVANPKSYPGTGTTFNDLTKNKNTATIAGTLPYSTSFGGIFTFNGTQYFTIPTTAAPQSNTSAFAFTYETWVRVADLTNPQTIYWTNGFLVITIETSGDVKIMIGISQVAITSTAPIQTGKWYHIAVTRQNIISATNVYYIYVNGVQLALSSNNTTSLVTNTPRFGYNSTAGSSFRGDFSNIKIYRGTGQNLSAAQLLQNYNAAKGRFGL